MSKNLDNTIELIALYFWPNKNTRENFLKEKTSLICNVIHILHYMGREEAVESIARNICKEHKENPDYRVPYIKVINNHYIIYKPAPQSKFDDMYKTMPLWKWCYQELAENIYNAYHGYRFIRERNYGR